MPELETNKIDTPSTRLFLRKLAKSGGTRYLAVGTIMPEDWEFVKVFAKRISAKVITLRLEKVE